MEQYNYTKYTCEYVFNGERYGITVPAQSWEEAEQRLKQIGNGVVLGVQIATIPHNLGCFAKILVQVRNLLFTQA